MTAAFVPNRDMQDTATLGVTACSDLLRTSR
jgi:hypothetical protein